MSHSLHLILGGSRSGKSRRAEELARESGRPVVYIATYATTTPDAEMQTRIEQHRVRRPKDWKTIENRFDLKNLLAENAKALILLDCLTLWLSYRQMESRDSEILAELDEALRSAGENGQHLIFVSSEVGAGIVPVSAEARRFRDLVGSANQLTARHATRVEFMVAGLPLVLKGTS